MAQSNSNLVLTAFDGAITVYRVQESTRAFYFDVTFYLDHPHLVKLGSAEKPPMHFHPHQAEYIKVLNGTLGVEVEASSHQLRFEDGEFCIEPWANHRLYPILPIQDVGASSASSPEPRTTRFLLSGEESFQTFQLDEVFFQNWYGYQDEVLLRGDKFDLIQVMNMFDAGGSYLTFPTWIPFSRRLAQMAGIIIGRWLGALLGYQPYYRKWTNDWSVACDKMGTSPILRHTLKQAKTD